MLPNIEFSLYSYDTQFQLGPDDLVEYVASYPMHTVMASDIMAREKLQARHNGKRNNGKRNTASFCTNRHRKLEKLHVCLVNSDAPIPQCPKVEVQLVKHT